MNEINAIGIMSGSSLDGLDICAASFIKEGGQWSFAIKSAKTATFPDRLLNSLKYIRNLSGLELSTLDIQLGTWTGQEVNEFIKSNHLKVDIIGSHGHTAFHQIENQLSVQIGNGHAIAKQVQIPVIADFRLQNVLNGGQGAPLVPIGDLLLFGEYDGFINLGGIANLSVRNGRNIMAGDVAPCNQVLNELASRLNRPYDDGGKIANMGSLDSDWLHTLSQEPFYNTPLPRSISNEWVAKNYLKSLPDIPVPNALFTFSAFIALQISKQFEGITNRKILVTGGGAYNDTLVSLIREKSPQNIFIVPDQDIIDYKEALIFAFMAVLNWKGEPNVLSVYTGANKDLISGVVFNP